MSSFDLRVAISKPLWGEYYHWCLDFYSETEDTHWVVEALGEPHQFAASSEDYDPESLPRSWKRIHVVRLEHAEVEDLQEVVESIPIRNDLAYWNCQGCVIKILDGLEEAKIVEKTSEYERVKRALITMVGPVEDTRRHILAHRAPGEEGDNEDYDRDDGAEVYEDNSDDDEKTPRVLSEELVVDSDDEGDAAVDT